MRNLKKILALVLALMMVLSVMVFASATNLEDYADSEQVSEEYAEAVDVLSGMGILKGSEGKLYPKDYVQRSHVSTMIYRMMSTDVADAQVHIYEDYGMFDDVSEDNWFAGFVNYSANYDLVKGVGDNKFNPSGYMTGYELITILLRAIGYDQNNEISGSDWKITAAGLAKQAGILGDFNETTLGSYLTREQIAYLMFNAMNVPQVTYTPALGYETDDLFGNVNDSIGWESFRLNRITGTVTQSSNDDVTVVGTVLNDQRYNSTGTAAVNESVIVSDDEVFETGRSAYVWTVERVSNVHTALTSPYYIDTVLATKYNDNYSGWTTAPTAWSPASQDFVAATDSAVRVYVNGSAGSLNAIKTGDEVRLIDTNSNGRIDLVLVLDETVETVGPNGVNTRTGANGLTYVTVDDIVEINATLASTVVGYEGLVPGDVVLYVQPYTGVQYLTKATVVTGTKTEYSTAQGYITFAGNPYYQSGLIGTAVSDLFNHTVPGTFGANYNLYLDRGGYAVEAAPIVNASSYAVVLDAGYELSTSVGTYGQYTFYATLLYLDGTSATVETDTLYRAAALSEDNLALAGKTPHNYINHFVRIGSGVNNGRAVTTLTLVTDAGSDDSCDVTGTTSFAPTNPNFGTNYYANNETVYLVLNADGTVSRYVGYANMPAMTAANYCVMTSSTYTRLAEYVYVWGGTNTASSTYYVWAQNANVSYTTKDWDGNGTYEAAYTYTGLYQNGQQVLITSSNDISTSIAALITSDNEYMEISVVNGYASVSGLYYADGVLHNRTVNYVNYSTETIELTGTSTAYPYRTAEVQVYDATGTTVVPTDIRAITAGDKVTALVDSNDYVVAIYKEADGGVINVLANANLANEWSVAGLTTNAITNRTVQVGDTFTITVTHPSTFGLDSYTLTLSNGQTATLSRDGGGSTLTFTFTVTEATLGYESLSVTYLGS